jgi:NADPH-dependent curcumin reductase CurA
MPEPTNRCFRLARRPRGDVSPDCFTFTTEEPPPLQEGQARVRVLYLSLDPTIRGWLNEEDTYLPAIRIGDVVRSGGVGEIVESRSARYKTGERVFGMTGWQELAVADEGANAMTVLPAGVAPTDALGVFGITGMTAYFGMLDVARPREGDTVLVSGAAGATGSVAGQIAKLHGCRVVGIAGGPEKCRWVTDGLGFDACIDYKGEDVGKRLDEVCPDGIDVYFDNVGGEILQQALARIRRGARIALCGGISGYNATTPPPGPNNLMQLVIQRARMEGFLVLDYMDRFPEAMARMAPWVAEGKVNNRVTVVEGLENTVDAFGRLFSGGNIGKLMVKVAEPA